LQSGALTEAEQIRRRDLGVRIAHGRREVGLTQRELAERIGASLNQIVRLEDGRTDPSPCLAQIADAMGLPPERFGVTFADQPSMSPPVQAPPPGPLPEVERLRQQAAELEVRLAEQAKAKARVSELEAALEMVEEQLLGRDQRITELSAQLDQLEQRMNGEPAAVLEEHVAPSESPLPLPSILVEPEAQSAPPEEHQADPGTSENLLGFDREPSWTWDDVDELDQAAPARRSGEETRPPRVAVRASRRRPLATRKAVIRLGMFGALVVLAVLGFTLFGGGHSSPAAHPATPAPTRPAVKPTVKPATTPSQVPVNGGSTVVPATPKPVRKAHVLLAPVKTPVLVLNGNGVAGAAGREGGLVRLAGYPVTRVTNALRQDYPASFVMYRAGLRAEALKLARALGVKSISLAVGLKPSELGRAKLVVVTGRS
jgi:transcriptional regulator with XRE-family HTH domain